jgi:hypothetical protein
MVPIRYYYAPASEFPAVAKIWEPAANTPVDKPPLQLNFAWEAEP